MQEGGEVLLEGQWDYIDDPFEIPDGPVYIVGVNMHGTVTEAKDYEPLSRLSKLREIFIPARLWSPTFDTKGAFSDEMFGYFARSKTLERLHAGLTSLAYLQDRRRGGCPAPPGEPTEGPPRRIDDDQQARTSWLPSSTWKCSTSTMPTSTTR